MNKLIQNLRYARVYSLVIAGLYALLLLCFYLYSGMDKIFFTAALLLIPVCIALAYFLGEIRSRELAAIGSVINAITEKKLAAPEEISLGSDLTGLETDIKKMYARIRQDIQYLKRLEQIRTEFLGNVSHELRTPIFAIQGYLETLLDGALYDEKVNLNFLNKANHHVQNLNSLLNDLIDISMIESGEMNLSFRYFELKEFLLDIVRDLKYQAEEKQLELRLAPVKDKLQVFGDKNRLRQVFVNLIQNAIKYTETGTIDIIVTEEAGSVRITLKDTGIGISERDIPRIFERFYRVDKDRSRSAGGTGLGLAIVKHIIEAHNSKIEVRSRLGAGTEFSFRLKR